MNPFLDPESDSESDSDSDYDSNPYSNSSFLDPSEDDEKLLGQIYHGLEDANGGGITLIQRRLPAPSLLPRILSTIKLGTGTDNEACPCTDGERSYWCLECPEHIYEVEVVNVGPVRVRVTRTPRNITFD